MEWLYIVLIVASNTFSGIAGYYVGQWTVKRTLKKLQKATEIKKELGI